MPWPRCLRGVVASDLVDYLQPVSCDAVRADVHRLNAVTNLYGNQRGRKAGMLAPFFDEHLARVSDEAGSKKTQSEYLFFPGSGIDQHQCVLSTVVLDVPHQIEIGEA